jgi:hypothetical protein
MTRTGSKGHLSLPKWMRERLDDIVVNQLLADTPIVTRLRPNIPSRQMWSAVPPEFSEDSVGDIGEQVQRDTGAAGDCLSRDSSSCLLTAERRPVVAHIIPYSCGCMTGYFDTS